MIDFVKDTECILCKCDICKNIVNIVAQLEAEEDIDSVWICKNCLEKALTLINKEIEKCG